MKKLNIGNITATGLLLIPILLGAGCAGLGTASSLEDRAQARWDALIEGDWDTAYQYLSPGSRAAMSRDSYAKMLDSRTIQWVSARAHMPHDCGAEAEACKVSVEIGYTVNRGVPGLRRQITLNKTVTESWVRSDGAWYFVPDRLR